MYLDEVNAQVMEPVRLNFIKKSFIVYVGLFLDVVNAQVIGRGLRRRNPYCLTRTRKVGDCVCARFFVG